jgi:hypothetical protein
MALRDVGADTLCISLDPFHAEYVPIGKALELAKICASIGFRFFLWQERFLGVMSGLDFTKVYSRDELEQLLSPRYVFDVARSYGLHFGGRAVNIETEYLRPRLVEEIADKEPCSSLLSGNHFHVDLNGNFVPPGCTGIIIPLDEVVNGIPSGKYPVLETLLSGGVAELLHYAKSLGFVADHRGYPSGCALCFAIRYWLSVNVPTPELDVEFYVESLRYY